MNIIKLEDALKSSVIAGNMIAGLKTGEIIIYPTDTVYGLGCNIESEASVKKIIEAKQRDPKKPLSIIAPSIEWVDQNCILADFNKNLLSSLFQAHIQLF